MADSSALGAPTPAGSGTGALNRFFKISERGSTLSRRSAAVLSPSSMAIVVLNPIIIGGEHNTDANGHFLQARSGSRGHRAGRPGVMSIIFGIVANYPFALAAGLGINSLLAVTIARRCRGRRRWAWVVIDGIIIVVLAATGSALPCSTPCRPNSRRRSRPVSGVHRIRRDGLRRIRPPCSRRRQHDGARAVGHGGQFDHIRCRR